MFRFFAAGLVLAFTLFAERPSARTESPEQVVQQFFEALRNRDWERCAQLTTTESLAHLREMINVVVRPETPAQVLREILGTGSREELEKLSDAQVYSRLLEARARMAPAEVAEALRTAEMTILGQVKESEDTRHIVYRQSVDMLGVKGSSIEVITLQRTAAGWRMKDMEELRGMATMFRNVPAATEDLPGTLVLIADADCTLWIDDADNGLMQAGVSRKIELKQGRHWLNAKTQDGLRQWGGFVQVIPSESRDVIIALRSSGSAPEEPTKPAAAGGNAPKYLTGNVTPPERITFVKPDYPQDARDRREVGKVVLEIVVDREGKVVDASVLKSNPTFDAAALQAVRQWKYKPATQNGHPVMVYLTVIVDFSLK